MKNPDSSRRFKRNKSGAAPRGAATRSHRRQSRPLAGGSGDFGAGAPSRNQGFFASLFPVDPIRIVDALGRRAVALVLLGLAVAIVAFNCAYLASTCTASTKLIRSVAAGVVALKLEAQAFGSRQESLEATVAWLRSPELLMRVAKAVGLPMTADGMTARCGTEAGAGDDPITLVARGRTPAEAVRLVNAYAREAVQLSAEVQREELREVQSFLSMKLAETDTAMSESSRKIIRSRAGADVSAPVFLKEAAEVDRRSEMLKLQLGTLDLQIARLVHEITKQHPALVKVREDLDRALIRYTDEHPKIKELRAALAAVREQIAQQATNAQSELSTPPNSAASALYLRVVDLQTQKIALEKQVEEATGRSTQLREKLQHLPETQVQQTAAAAEFEALKTRRDLLSKYQSDVQFMLGTEMGWLRLSQPAKVEHVRGFEKLRRALWTGAWAGLLAFSLGAMAVAILECLDRRIRTQKDLERATRLPVLATLGDLDAMSTAERDDWAFRTMTSLRGKLGKSGGRPLVCGIISAINGEGRSTWVDLLAGAARRRGSRVLVISQPDFSPPSRGSNPNGEIEVLTNIAETQAGVAEVVTRSDLTCAPPLALPASPWNPQWRGHWREALSQWNQIEDLVLLVDLPPASNPEAILLTEEIPQLIWLCEKDRVTTTETRSQMEMLRCSKCELVGSVFNRAGIPAWRRRITNWSHAAVFFTCLAVGGRAGAAEPESTPPPVSLSVVGPSRLADWQKKFTLGPGDVLNISLYDEADSFRDRLTIGPDGRLNYLEAQDVSAAGLTVDELRTQLDEILGKFHRAARTVIIPVAYKSKRYFMLGNVMQKGSFQLDRPVTMLEAVARANGFVAKEGMILADLSRSFLIRSTGDGKFAPVTLDFEGLFLRGDLSQNQPLAPDDYLYFPPTDLPEVYVLGDVRIPGVVPYSPNMTLLKALSVTGGFNEKAYKSKVLVVRGSLSHPEAFIVNAAGALTAKNSDFPIRPRDIIYVNRRPWAKVEELLEVAVSDFLRAALVTWTGQNIGPIITDPFVPELP